MNTIAKIRAEIERQSKSIENATGDFAEGRRLEQRVILAFLDTLEEPEQPTMGYDEAYLNEKIAKASKSWEGVDVDKFMDEVRGREPVSDCHDLEEAADEWCKTNNKGIALCADKKSHYLAEGIDAFIAGAEWQKAKMMEGAVEGKVIVPIYDEGDIWSTEIEIPGRYEPSGSKIKVIVVKEDGK